jgi:hypothetical protein
LRCCWAEADWSLIEGEEDMRLKVVTTAALALSLAAILHPRAAVSADGDDLNRLIQAAYFSDACRREAAALGIAPTSDAGALLASFATLRRQLAAGPGDDPPNAQLDDCRAPVVLLINLLRGNGLDAELVFAVMAPTSASAVGASSDKIDRVLVYVAALDRYVDPTAPLGKQAVLDRIIRERAKRSHLQGPSLAGDARAACPGTCMHVYPPGGASIRAKTEVIRGR